MDNVQKQDEAVEAEMVEDSNLVSDGFSEPSEESPNVEIPPHKWSKREKKLYVDLLTMKKRFAQLQQQNAQLRIQIAQLESDAVDAEITQNASWMLAENYIQTIKG